MKKLLYSLFLMAIATMTFTSCENVPEPYDNPNGNKEKPTPGAKIEPAGKGTEADPYNVAAAMQLLKAAKADEPTAPMYVRGKIVEIQGVETKRMAMRITILPTAKTQPRSFTFSKAYTWVRRGLLLKTRSRWVMTL